MDTLEFLAAVLPSSGKYCTFTYTGEKRKNIFVRDLPALYNTTKQISLSGAEAFIATGTFDDTGLRKAENAVAMKSFFMDLDCGVSDKGQPKAFTSKKAARLELDRWLRDTGLGSYGAPLLIDSGGGIHVWFPLTEEISIEEWKPIAEGIKVSAHNHKFLIDATVTADAARVLRLPDCLNHKYTPARTVVLREEGTTFDIDAFRTLFLHLTPVVTAPKARNELMLPGAMPTGKSAAATALMNNTRTSFRKIIMLTQDSKGCGQVANYISNAADDGMEPIWRGMLSWTKVCDDGEKASEKMTLLHPYDIDRMHRKLGEIKGPYSCVKMNTIQAGICTKCPHFGKITNPLILGREVLRAAPEPAAPAEEGATLRPTLPQPPFPYWYGLNGGVYFTKKSDKKDEDERDIMLTAYNLYMTRMFRDEAVYKSEFCAVKGDKTVTFVIPNSHMGSVPKIIESLAANNVMAAHGIHTDAYLAAYVRACVTAASNTEETVVIPPTMGWQPDGGFAVGDIVYGKTPDLDYLYKSDRLHNLIQATMPKGTLAGWQAPFDMMRRKKMWGHLAYAMSGFGSILMQYMPENSRACVIHMCGAASSAGKSLALSMNSSIWGSHARYKVKSDTSLTTMMQRAGLWGSLPLNVDEVTTQQRDSNGEFIPKLAFSYSEGSHKIKGSATGNNEIAHELLWAGKMHITSNSPAFEAMLGARKHTSNGEARRMLEWVLQDDQVIEWTDEERKILVEKDNHYGVAGRMFSAWCARNEPFVREICAKTYDYWRQYAGATDDERFWTSSIAADISATILCNEKLQDRLCANVLTMPWEPLAEFWLRRVKEQRAMIDFNKVDALDFLNLFIRENSANFVKVEGTKVSGSLLDFGKIRPDMPRSALKGRIEINVTPGTKDVFIEEKMLREHCGAGGRSYTGFLKELGKIVSVSTVSRKNLFAGTDGPTMGVKCVRIMRDSALADGDDAL